MKSRWHFPLWLKILIAALSVQVLVLFALGYASVSLVNQALLQQNETRLNELRPLLNANIASALFQRDLAGIRMLFKYIQRNEGIRYLRLVDESGKLIATIGTPIVSTHSLQIPANLPNVIHNTLLIKIDDLVVGTLYFDLATDVAQRTQQQLILRGLLIAVIATVIAFMLLLLLSLRLTRRLEKLTQASVQLATGNLHIELFDNSRDEVGKLNTAFNQMSSSLRQRIGDLHAMQISQQQSLRHAQAEQTRLNALLSAMNLGILFVDNDGKIIYYNPAFTEIWRLTPTTSLIGQMASLVMSTTNTALQDPAAFTEHLHQKHSSEYRLLEIDMLDGRVITHSIRTILADDAQIIGALWIFEDVTNERRTAQKLTYMAERDALTGLYNRRSFESALQRAFQEHARHPQTGALLFIDLDGFKYVNDAFGHHTGDEVLSRIATVMTTQLRTSEALYRLGGDEFAVLLTNIDLAGAQTLASRLTSVVAQIPFQFNEALIRITTSIGIALYPEHAQDDETLVARADAAMYQAKQAGKNSWRVYQAEADSSQSEVFAMHWHQRIDLALQLGLFVIYLQGIYKMDEHTPCHYEVLIRLQEKIDTPPTLPAQFIPIAECSGQILAIDRWVLKQSIMALATHADLPALAVNLSARSLDDASLIQYIAEQVDYYQIDSARLMIEITETAALSDLQDAQRTILSLRLMGCSVSLDDFGTGFASFAYLKYLDADILKIDGLFIRTLHEEPDNRIFIQAIVDVAHGLGKQTVAECVETADTYAVLKELGVDMAQGYYLHKPTPLV